MSYGGGVISSGTYGVVNYPAIRCEKTADGTARVSLTQQSDGLMPEKEGIASKVLLTEDAEKEYNEVKILVDRARQILGEETCDKYLVLPTGPPCLLSADAINEEDINDVVFSSQTRDTKYLIDKGKRFLLNAREHPSEYRIISMPFGGIDVKVKFIDLRRKASSTPSNVEYLQDLDKLTQGVINAYQYALLPLNEKGIYHKDLKSANMVVDTRFDVRIIDWGLSTVALESEVNDDKIDYSKMRERKLAEKKEEIRLKYPHYSNDHLFKMALQEYDTLVPGFSQWNGHMGAHFIMEYDEVTLRNNVEKMATERSRDPDQEGKNHHLRTMVDIINISLSITKNTSGMTGIRLLSEYVNHLRAHYQRNEGEFPILEFVKDHYMAVDLWGIVMTFGEWLITWSDMPSSAGIPISEAVLSLFDRSNVVVDRPFIDSTIGKLRTIKFTPQEAASATATATVFVK